MKRLILSCIAIVSLMAAAFSVTSCIYDAPGDEFYRTLWKSTPEPLGIFHTDELTVEFLCDNKITVKDGGRIIAHGTYASDDHVAVLTGLEPVIDGTRISFVEAHRSGDTLFLLWRSDLMSYPSAISLDRLSPWNLE